MMPVTPKPYVGKFRRLLLLGAFCSKIAAQNDTSLIYNPGPTYQCYGFSENQPCASDTAYTDYYSECAGLTPNSPSFTASWYNSGVSSPGQFPAGANGSPMNVTLINRALSTDGCTCGGDACCNLTEVTFEYTYPGYAIKKLSNGDQYNLADYDQWLVEYDATIHADPTCDACAEWTSKCSDTGNTYPGDCQVDVPAEASACQGYTREYLTTDFIYYWGNNTKNLISIIHFNPFHTNANVGPFLDMDYYNGDYVPGYRIAVNGPPGLIPGQTTHIALDFKALVEQYSAQLCHGGDGAIPSALSLYSLQVVSSNVNTSSVIDITNAKITLRNDPDPSITYPSPTTAYSSTPTYCPQ